MAAIADSSNNPASMKTITGRRIVLWMSSDLGKPAKLGPEWTSTTSPKRSSEQEGWCQLCARSSRDDDAVGDRGDRKPSALPGFQSASDRQGQRRNICLESRADAAIQPAARPWALAASDRPSETLPAPDRRLYAAPEGSGGHRGSQPVSHLWPL